mgnify:CR=1 FL=1
MVTYGPGLEGGGLKLRSKYGFETAPNQEGPWTRAVVIANTKTSVTLKTNGTAAATMLRYAYDDLLSIFTDTGPAVYNAEGIPANPGTYNITKE